MYGHPGTGKTMFAKQLAKSCGMDYAILTGGDIAPLGREAVPELHKIFDWSQHSDKGLLLFVDEADAFLRKRGGDDASEMSEDLRNALNAFLYRTGEASKDFMVVFASNQPEQLDWAVQDRVDEMVEFHLPGPQQRKEMLTMYFHKYITNAEGSEEGHEKSGGGVRMPWKNFARTIGTDDIGTFIFFVLVSCRLQTTFLAGIAHDFPPHVSSRVLSLSLSASLLLPLSFFPDDVDQKLESYIEMTEGFSGREIEKVAIAWQASAYGSVVGDLSGEMMDEVISTYSEQAQAKRNWR